MKNCYIIEMGGEKEVYEMNSLELEDVNQARGYIQGLIESDAEYYNFDINCIIIDLVYEEYDSKTNFYYKGVVLIDIKNIGEENIDFEKIIESDLSIISKIKTKMSEV